MHAITKDGPLTTRDDASDAPHYGDHFAKARGGKSLKPRPMGEGEHTAEYLFVGNTKGDYHESMNSQNFGEWVQQRLVPTFEAKYPGKKMILVLDNAPCVRARGSMCVSPLQTAPGAMLRCMMPRYHHNIALPSLTGLNKKELVKLLSDNGRCTREHAPKRRARNRHPLASSQVQLRSTCRAVRRR